MSIQLTDVRIYEDIGRPEIPNYVIDMRFIDPDKGTHTSDYGLELWNWDKAASVGSDESLEEAIERASDTITRILCSEGENPQ